MSMHSIILPSKPSIVSEEGNKGIYEIENLYPGYGHTLGNSLRRIILSSLPGAAVTTVKIEGASHEFSTLDGVKEDVITILLNLKKVRFKLLTDEPQIATLSVKGPKAVTAGDIEVGGQIEVLNPDFFIAELTGKGSTLNIEMTIEKGLGFISKENLQKNKVEIGTIALDAIFSPIRRVAYEVENMRVGDNTNYNKLRVTVETDGTLPPREALETSVRIMLEQFRAILDFKVPEIEDMQINSGDAPIEENSSDESGSENGADMSDVMKTRIDTLNLSTRTLNALMAGNIRTIGGIARKKNEDLLEIPGLGEKGVQEIKKFLGEYGITLK